MRTTLDVADDVLLAARELARREGKIVGQVLSELAREALRRPAASPKPSGAAEQPESFLGFHPFPSRGGEVTNDLVDRLRDEDASE
jgi:hypothetical protein